jgi:hypothetical protein
VKRLIASLAVVATTVVSVGVVGIGTASAGCSQSVGVPAYVNCDVTVDDTAEVGGAVFVGTLGDGQWEFAYAVVNAPLLGPTGAIEFTRTNSGHLEVFLCADVVVTLYCNIPWGPPIRIP